MFLGLFGKETDGTETEEVETPAWKTETAPAAPWEWKARERKEVYREGFWYSGCDGVGWGKGNLFF